MRRVVLGSSPWAVVLLVAGYATPRRLRRRPRSPDPGQRAGRRADDADARRPVRRRRVAQPRDADAGMPLAASGQQQPVPTAAGLQAATAGALADPALAGKLGVTVRDAATGTHLLDRRPGRPRSSRRRTSSCSRRAAVRRPPSRSTRCSRRGWCRAPTPTGSCSSPAATRCSTRAPETPRRWPVAPASPTSVTGTASACTAKGVTQVAVSLDLTYAPGPLLRADLVPGVPCTSGITGAVAAIGPVRPSGPSRKAGPGRPGGRGRSRIRRRPARRRAMTATLARHPGPAPEGASTLATRDLRPGPATSSALALRRVRQRPDRVADPQAAYTQGDATRASPQAAAFVRTTVGGLGVDLTGVPPRTPAGFARDQRAGRGCSADVIAAGCQRAGPSRHARHDARTCPSPG